MPSGKPGSCPQVSALTQFHIHELLWISTGKGIFHQSKRAECSRHGCLIPDCRHALRNPCKTYFPIKRNALTACFSSWDSAFSSHLQLFAYCIWTVQDKEGIISKTLFFHHFTKTRKKHIWKNKNEDLSGGEGLKFYLGLLLFQEWAWQIDWRMEELQLSHQTEGRSQRKLSFTNKQVSRTFSPCPQWSGFSFYKKIYGWNQCGERKLW